MSSHSTDMYIILSLFQQLEVQSTLDPITKQEVSCLTLEELAIALYELNLWPSETNLEDRREIAFSLLASHPDFLCLLQGYLGPP